MTVASRQTRHELQDEEAENWSVDILKLEMMQIVVAR